MSYGTQMDDVRRRGGSGGLRGLRGQDGRYTMWNERPGINRSVGVSDIMNADSS